MVSKVETSLMSLTTLEVPKSNNTEEPPNEDNQRFYNLLVEANELLYEGTTDSKLSISVRLLSCKSN